MVRFSAPIQETGVPCLASRELTPAVLPIDESAPRNVGHPWPSIDHAPTLECGENHERMYQIASEGESDLLCAFHV